MGFTTIVGLGNDAFDQFRKNPKQLVDGVIKFSAVADCTEKIPVGNAANYATVVKSEHMDIPQLILAHENWVHPFNTKFIDHMKGRGQLDLVRGRLKTAEIELKFFKKYLEKAEST